MTFMTNKIKKLVAASVGTSAPVCQHGAHDAVRCTARRLLAEQQAGQ